MLRKSPLISELRSERCASWKKETEGKEMPDLAQQIISTYGTDGVNENEKGLVGRFRIYKRTVNPPLPALEYCVPVEHLLELAKGQIYRAIAQTEQAMRRTLEARFGELPQRFDPENPQYYGSTVSTPVAEIDSIGTIGELDMILNSGGMHSGDLASAIGNPKISRQRIANLRTMARKDPIRRIPVDLALEISRGILVLREGKEAPNDEGGTSSRTTSIPETKELTSDGLRIVGFGGIEVNIPTQFNFRDGRLVLTDGRGNQILKGGELCIPPTLLTEGQREDVRKWIAETLVSRMV